MKKYISLILIVFISFSIFAEIPTAFADTEKEYKGFCYTVNDDNTVSVISYNYNKKSIKIPEKIENKNVVSIRKKAFQNVKKLSEIIIPATVKKISDFSVGYNENGKKNKKLKILGYKKSRANTYAKSNGFKFTILPEKITLDQTSFAMGKKEKIKLKVTLYPKGAKSDIKFLSFNDYIAKVDKKGNITAKNVGKTKIRVKANGIKVYCKVNVKKTPKYITINQKSLTIGKKEVITLKVHTDKGSYSRIKWGSSKKGIVVLKQVRNNKVEIKGRKKGSTYIVAKTYNGKKIKCKIKVKKTPRKVKISKKELWLEKGKSFDLNYTLSNGSASYHYEFYSTNPKIVTVNPKTGVVKAKKYGSASIKIKLFNGLKGKCKIKVKKQVGFNAYNGTDISTVLGIDHNKYIKWMKSHEKDKYYVDTQYRPFDCRNPNGDCSGKNGSNNIYGQPGLNCTGFVWHALTIPCRQSNGNTGMIPTLGGWVSLFENYGITRRQFSTVEEMLCSGFLEQGDVLFIANKSDEHMLSNHHHVGIYWGDGDTNVFWHSLGSRNRISTIFTMGENPKYIALKFKK